VQTLQAWAQAQAPVRAGRVRRVRLVRVAKTVDLFVRRPSAGWPAGCQPHKQQGHAVGPARRGGL